MGEGVSECVIRETLVFRHLAELISMSGADRIETTVVFVRDHLT